MAKLKVGDKVVNIRYGRFGDKATYKFSEVVRVTKTQAILANELRLVNEPKTKFSSNEVEFSVYGGDYERWELLTPKIQQEFEQEQERRIIENWFCSKKFTDEEKKMIYEQFK